MFTGAFWKQTGERAVKTFAQALAGLWAGDQFNILSVNWEQSLGVAAGMTVLSVLTSVVSAPVGDTDSPSLVDTK